LCRSFEKVDVFLTVGVAAFLVLWEACRPVLGLLEKKVLHSDRALLGYHSIISPEKLGAAYETTQSHSPEDQKVSF
jgi:hypothetical protein